MVHSFALHWIYLKAYVYVNDKQFHEIFLKDLKFCDTMLLTLIV